MKYNVCFRNCGIKEKEMERMLVICPICGKQPKQDRTRIIADSHDYLWSVCDHHPMPEDMIEAESKHQVLRNRIREERVGKST